MLVVGDEAMSVPASLVEGEDYYREGEAFVFTERYHLRRGYCCESGCRHCPYGETTAGAPGTPKIQTE